MLSHLSHSRSSRSALINGTSQPIVHTANLQNVPERALFGFDPTCYFGVYMPDTFWLKEER